ncbi:hypothetical protein [Lacticaseibacillus thailandensis]|uniref:Uncharacterized protein n=1 Tax=Lacticaseibacillus thailandensis DSM 22698 = JCM 13996 TaxID=1423810 RepID=A0A0R2C7X0_9LACO|nr:hypothetical protein [Lacticaseibacillus thailandensis]KRM87655.1 hypothetical protein FD19_GL001176 [Lacticaseibacillus thailandensis DSM 22698 = JCM 13996]
MAQDKQSGSQAAAQTKQPWSKARKIWTCVVTIVVIVAAIAGFFGWRQESAKAKFADHIYLVTLAVNGKSSNAQSEVFAFGKYDKKQVAFMDLNYFYYIKKAYLRKVQAATAKQYDESYKLNGNHITITGKNFKYDFKPYTSKKTTETYGAKRNLYSGKFTYNIKKSGKTKTYKGTYKLRDMGTTNQWYKTVGKYLNTKSVSPTTGSSSTSK